MRWVVLIIILLLLIAITINLPPKEITLKDLHPAVAPLKITKEPAIRGTTLIDSSKTDGYDQIQKNYYIIVGSFRNLVQAQQKAEKLRNAFYANIIILPPTTEGYYRISYGKYSTPEEAKDNVKSIRSNINSDAWIFSAKN